MSNAAKPTKQLSVGEMARRSGVPVSTLHFYEAKGLIRPTRSAGNQRVYARGMLRRVALIKVAQRLGIPLGEIGAALAGISHDRAPTAAEWAAVSGVWALALQQRIDGLLRLRDSLQSCIGCGCLSLAECPLRNTDDYLGRQRAGAVLLEPVPPGA